MDWKLQSGNPELYKPPHLQVFYLINARWHGVYILNMDGIKWLIIVVIFMYFFKWHLHCISLKLTPDFIFYLKSCLLISNGLWISNSIYKSSNIQPSSYLTYLPYHKLCFFFCSLVSFLSAERYFYFYFFLQTFYAKSQINEKPRL